MGSIRNVIHGDTSHLLYITNNAYVNTGNAWKYTSTAGATNYYAYAGIHHFRVAASGSADATITWTEAMTILANGNVGIGTDNPGVDLDIYSSAGQNYLKMSNVVSGVTTNSYIGYGGNKNFSVQAGGNNQFQIYTNSKRHQSWYGDGMIKMGEESVGSGVQFIERRDASGNLRGTLFRNETVEWALGSSTGNGSSKIFMNATRLRSAMPIYIGADSADNAFDDGSNGSASTTMYIGDEIIDTTVPSDAILKENINDTSIRSLPILEQLKLRDFNWKADSNHGVREDRQFGMIAQEVEEVLPHLVRKDSEGIRSVEYNKMVPYLVKAIQELEKELDELKRGS